MKNKLTPEQLEIERELILKHTIQREVYRILKETKLYKPKIRNKKLNPIITLSRYDDGYRLNIDSGNIKCFYGGLPVVIVKGLIHLMKRA